MSEWISVDERLPEPSGQPCIVWVPDRSEFSETRYGAGHGLGSVGLAVYSKEWGFAAPSPTYEKFPSHWMPLPDPPKP